MEVKSFLKEAYSQLPLKNHSEENFYIFLKHTLEEYTNSLSKIDKKDISEVLSDVGFSFFKSTYTLQRLINLIKHINKDILEVLALRYKGDVLNSIFLLYKILFNQKYSRYLEQEYSGYFRFDKTERPFYRMRDAKVLKEDKTENIVENCWHVPYNNRAYAYSGRYSMPSFPALYLGNTKQTCVAELGQLKKGYRRWVSRFDCKSSIWLFDLRVHSAEDIDGSSLYEQLCYLITYPVIAACTAERSSKNSDEEYFFSQLLFHLLLLTRNVEKYHQGIIYSSTKIKGGENIVIPATYEETEPPKDGYSEKLKNIFEVSTPEIYQI